MFDELFVAFLVPIIVGVALVLGSFLYYRDKSKVDKGRAVAYYKLTYRQRYKHVNRHCSACRATQYRYVFSPQHSRHS